MSIFNLTFRCLGTAGTFARSFFTIEVDGIREFVDRSLVDEARLWPDFLLQVSPSYARDATVGELAARGAIVTERCYDFGLETSQLSAFAAKLLN